MMGQPSVANVTPASLDSTSMKREYGFWKSGALGRPMEFVCFGDRGRLVIFFPTSIGRFYQNEDFGLTGALADKVDAGWLQLVCVDSVDAESRSEERRVGKEG